MLDDIASLSLQTAILGLGTRQQVTSNNIANVETPGFTASDVSFESSLADAISGGAPTQATVSVDASNKAANIVVFMDASLLRWILWLTHR